MPTSWSELRGHTGQRELFRRSIARGRLSHAYILTGPEGIGKLQFARLLAKSMFCRERTQDQVDACGECRACRGFEARTWPDYYEIHRPEGKTEIPIELLVGSKEKRGREGMCYELAMAPQASDRRIAVINDAQLMNEEGANALLKTLEEPPADALMLLISHNPDALLPTIRSRCQMIRFFPLTDQDVADLLVKHELVETQADAQVVSALAEGSLAIAQQLLNPDLRKLRESIAEQFSRLEKMQPLVLADHIADELERISGSVEEQRQNARWLLRFTADVLRQRLHHLAKGDLSDPLTQRLGVRLGVDLLSPMLQEVSRAIMLINANTTVRLVLESTLNELARQLRLGPITARP